MYLFMFASLYTFADTSIHTYAYANKYIEVEVGLAWVVVMPYPFLKSIG